MWILSSLTASSDQVSGLFDGSASGNISFDASGCQRRSDLLASLTCHGAARIKNAEIGQCRLSRHRWLLLLHNPAGVYLLRSVPLRSRAAIAILFFKHLLFVSPQLQMDFVGSASFDRSLNFRFRTLSQR